MADLFDKCDVFMNRMRRSTGADFDKLDDVFHRVFPFNNSAPHIEMRGRDMIQVSTNDYLGLAMHPEAIAAAAAVTEEYGIGTPLGARPLVQTLRKSFGEPVRQRLGHDGIVLIVVFFEAFGQLLASMACRNGKCADVIDPPALARRNKVGKRQLWLAALIVFLLAQRVQARQLVRARHIGVNDNIVAVAVRREKAVDAVGRE